MLYLAVIKAFVTIIAVMTGFHFRMVVDFAKLTVMIVVLTFSEINMATFIICLMKIVLPTSNEYEKQIIVRY